MRQTTAILFGFCFLLFSLTACKDKTIGKADTLRFIPATSTSVSALNPDRLLQKADFEQVKDMEFYKEEMQKLEGENPGLAAIMADPYRSGVDLKKNAYISYSIAEANLEDNNGVLTFSLADASAFESALKSAGLPKAESRSGFQWIEFDRNGGLAYTDEMGIIVFSSKGNADLAGLAQSVLETTPETSVIQNSDLQDLLKEDHDFLSWTSLDAFGKNPDVKFGTSMAGIPAEALEGNSIRTYADFTDGAVVSESNFFLKKDLTRDLDLLFKDEVKTDFSPYIPAEDNLFAFAAALDVEGLNQVLKERPQFKGFMDYALKEYGLSFDDLVATLQGDLMLSGYGEEGAYNGIFVTGLRDAKQMNNFLEVGVEFGIFEKDGDLYRIQGNRVGATNPYVNTNGYFFVEGDLLFATADQSLIEKIKNGGLAKKERLSKDALKQINSHIFGSYVNFATINKFVEEMDFSEVEDLMFSLDRRDSKTKIRFEEEGQNSLKTIFELINKAYLKNKANQGMDM